MGRCAHRLDQAAGGWGCWALPPPRDHPPPCLGEKAAVLGLQPRLKPHPSGRQHVGGSAPRSVSISVCRACTWGDLGVTVPGDRSPPRGLSFPSQPCQHAQHIQADISVCGGLSPPSNLPPPFVGRFKFRTTRGHSTQF